MGTDEITKIRLWPGDRAILLAADTDLVRALEYPSGHPVWGIWRRSEQTTELYDATRAVVVGTGTQNALPDDHSFSDDEGIRLLASGSLVAIKLAADHAMTVV